MTNEPKPVEYGNPDMAREHCILLTEVGSKLHGTALSGTDDTDLMGIYIEPPEIVFNPLIKAHEVYTHRSQPEGVRSGPGDTDLVVYPLRKYLQLAAKGNANVILPLFAPPSGSVRRMHYLGRELRRMKAAFLSVRTARAFLGFMRTERARFAVEYFDAIKRPELIAQHGYDTKAAGHALRLGYQCIELLTTGDMKLPMESAYREHVVAVRRGEYSRAQVLRAVDDLEQCAAVALERGGHVLPHYPDDTAITRYSMYAHREHWRWNAKRDKKHKNRMIA